MLSLVTFTGDIADTKVVIHRQKKNKLTLNESNDSEVQNSVANRGVITLRVG